MPPPTAADTWLTSRAFGIVIDAGSSGSRLQLYSWIDTNAVRVAGGQLNKLPQVVKGTKDADEWISKVEPGISSFAHNLDGIGPYLAPLLNHAREHIPPHLHKDTPIFLLSTAGMRLLPPNEQSAILSTTCDFLRFHSNFKVSTSFAHRPCGNHVRVISGEEEGLFGWIATNYLMDSFSTESQSKTFGFLDMGGASTQIAFEPLQDTPMASKENLHRVRLRLMNGDEISHNVFVTTWLGYGTNQARERFVDQLAKASSMSDGESYSDPCLPMGLRRIEALPNNKEGNAGSITSVGTGSFSECLAATHSLLNKTVACINPPCLFNGVHVPHIDFNVSKFIGVSEYWYSSEHVFGLGGTYNFHQYKKTASDFCASSWDDIVGRYRVASLKGSSLDDSSNDPLGEVVTIGKQENDIEISRLEMQCFKAAWIVNILHEGIGLPKEAELKHSILGNTEMHQGKKEVIKGLTAPTFQSLDTIEDTAVSWSLGTMILEASKEVPPRLASQPELPHPMVTSTLTVDDKLPPDPTMIEEDDVQPPSFMFPLFALFLAGTLILSYLLRRTLRPFLFHLLRKRRRRADYGFEEGHGSESCHVSLYPRNGRLQSAKSSSETDNTDNLLISATQKLRGPPASSRTFGSPSRNKIPLTLPDDLPSKDSGKDIRLSPQQSSSQSLSSLNSIQLIPGPESQSVRPTHPLYTASLSRNSSQTNLVPRSTASRIGSGSLTPSGTHFVED